MVEGVPGSLGDTDGWDLPARIRRAAPHPGAPADPSLRPTAVCLAFCPARCPASPLPRPLSRFTHECPLWGTSGTNAGEPPHSVLTHSLSLTFHDPARLKLVLVFAAGARRGAAGRRWWAAVGGAEPRVARVSLCVVCSRDGQIETVK